MQETQRRLNISSLHGILQRPDVIFYFSSITESLVLTQKQSEEPSIQKNSEESASHSFPVRPNKEEQIMNRESLLKLLREKIIIPEKKQDQPYLDILVGPVRSLTNASFLAAIASGIYRDLYYQPIKYFSRHEDTEPIVIGAKESGSDTRIFMKFTLGPLISELVDPVSILTDLGYDQRKIRIIQTLRDPSEIYFSVKRLGVDDMLPSEFKEMYIFILSLFSRYIWDVNSDTARPTTIFYELVKDYTIHEKLEELMETMFGQAFFPKFPSLPELLAMDNVHWLEANPHKEKHKPYFDKFILPVLNIGEFSGGVSLTDINSMISKKPELEAEAAELVDQQAKYLTFTKLLTKK